MNKIEEFNLGLRQVLKKTVIMLCFAGLFNVAAYFLDFTFVFRIIHRFTFLFSIPIILGFLVSIQLRRKKGLFWEFINGLFLFFNGLIIIFSLVILIFGLTLSLSTFPAWLYFIPGVYLFFNSIKITQGSLLYKETTLRSIEKWKSKILDDEGFLNL